MKIFDDNSGWGEKVNFVDSNNVFVGYDLSQDCCEHAGWFLSDGLCNVIPDDCQQASDLEDYAFDLKFFSEQWCDSLDQGGMVAFRIVNSKGSEKFLHLFNSHNGYYKHGFQLKHGDKVIKDDML